MFLGIADIWVLLAYLLCPFFALVCIVYGAINWNKDSEAITPEDIKWAKEEDAISEDL